jgi:hypothetical protein
MTPKPDRRPTETEVNEKETPPRKRFRIEKVEERIVPKKGGQHYSQSSDPISSIVSLY